MKYLSYRRVQAPAIINQSDAVSLTKALCNHDEK